ncbi:MAG: hypothetical protein K2Q01_09660 [Rickettsiales bacterium]|nr:hypothetical protein [Rickettsiales bacterium]
MSPRFHWQKKGHIFCADGRYPWMQTHGQLPVLLRLEDRLRIYMHTRPVKGADGRSQAYPTFIDVDYDDPQKILQVHDRPILEAGELGTFDQFGLMGVSVVRHANAVWLYYGGWSRSIGVPYHQAIGLAISTDEGVTFSRYGKGPIITRTPQESFIQNSPVVQKYGDVFHMWYGTGMGWVTHGSAVEPIYKLVHATSANGIKWERNGIPFLPSEREDECQTVPSVIQIGQRYHMWFSYRNGTDFRNAARGYRIGYAWSDDLLHWHRDDARGALLPSSGNGWDSEMVCYAQVMAHKGKLMMFYCGNQFGQTGFGYAVADI